MRVLSGIQPTGQFHLGNYLGALKNWVKLQDDTSTPSTGSGQASSAQAANECFYTVVDLHALTSVHDGETLRKNILESKLTLLAIGLDPTRSTLFVQSHIPAHTELAWILNTITPIGELERMTQYKEKAQQVGKSNAINAGLLTYPTLMAADILLYSPDYVPVGEDQTQHLEITRNIADKFNKTYAEASRTEPVEVFKLPKAMLQKDIARVMSLQDPAKKMSKSLGPNNYIGLFENEDEIRDKIKKAVTDSGAEIEYDPKEKLAISNLLAIYSGVTDKPIADIEKEFAGKSYSDFKSALAEEVVNHLRPIREKYKELKENPSSADEIFLQGSERAKEEAEKIMSEVRNKIGIR